MLDYYFFFLPFLVGDCNTGIRLTGSAPPIPQVSDYVLLVEKTALLDMHGLQY